MGGKGQKKKTSVLEEIRGKCLGNQRRMFGINDTQMARATCHFPRETKSTPTHSSQQLKAESVHEVSTHMQ